MKRTKEIFQEQRKMEEFADFDHEKNFCKKVKENWLSNADFAKLISADLTKLTQALIDKKMDDEYMDELMKLIDKKEPFHLGRKSDYFKMVLETPLENMQRVYKKYTEGLQYSIQQDYRIILETEILKKKRKLNENNN